MMYSFVCLLVFFSYALISCVVTVIFEGHCHKLLIFFLIYFFQSKIDVDIKDSKAEAFEGSTVLQKNTPSTNEATSKNYDNICLTKGCIHSASKVLDAMDPTVEPCDDFYYFACGNFVKNTNIPDEKISVNTFSIIGDRLQEQLRTLVSEEINY